MHGRGEAAEPGVQDEAQDNLDSDEGGYAGDEPADSGAAQTARLIMDGLAKDDSAAVLALGDNTYPSGRPTEFTSCYEPTWGRFKARTYSAPGNHEYYTQGATGYYGYFGDAAGPAKM